MKVVEVMHGLGFEESMGMHDFVYKWKEKAESKTSSVSPLRCTNVFGAST